MNPLSAIRQTGLTEQALPLGKTASGEVSSKAIPLHELQQLSSNEFNGGHPVNPADRSFGSVLGELVQEVNAKQSAAGAAVNGVLSGKQASLHQAVIAMEEASVSFQLMVEVRNKLLESYQELMRMQM